MFPFKSTFFLMFAGRVFETPAVGVIFITTVEEKLSTFFYSPYLVGRFQSLMRANFNNHFTLVKRLNGC